LFQRPGEEYETPRQMPFTRWTIVSPGYFDALDVPILAGRDFGPFDRPDTAAVAIINQDFADKEWPGENPIGKSVDIWMGEEAEAEDPNAGVFEVVGLVPDLRFAEFDNADDQQAVYVVLAQNPVRFSWVIAETRNDPAGFVEPLRRTVQAVDPDLPLYFTRTMEQVLSETLFLDNLMGVMFSSFAAAALFLACIGLYGLMSFAVTQRTQEMGVRMALGAARTDVQGLVVRQGLVQTWIGLVFGIGLGWALSEGLSSQLYAFQQGDPVAYVGVPIALVLVAILACLVPARRASKVDPMVALRYE
ncbi:MAG: FtsX-like permease family protein, partial [Acidobacteriota bacterium]